MTKTELQSALVEATQTDKKTAGAFLNALAAIAYKAVKKDGEFTLPGFGKLTKRKRAARTQFNPQTRQKMKVAAKAPSPAGQAGKQASPLRPFNAIPGLPPPTS
jgi:DNA-binding protein HU-beta